MHALGAAAPVERRWAELAWGLFHACQRVRWELADPWPARRVRVIKLLQIMVASPQ